LARISAPIDLPLLRELVVMGAIRASFAGPAIR